jgi:hypothetical protein
MPPGLFARGLKRAASMTRHPGVKIITYHLEGSYPRNSFWEFRPLHFG